MGRHPTPTFAALSALVPRGYEAYWEIVKELDRAGPWTPSDVCARTNTAAAAADYVRRLAKSAYVVKVDERPGPITPQPVYRLTSRPAPAPRLRRDGSVCPPTAQDQMWRAMRELKDFTALELAVKASTDEVRVPVASAKSYIKLLRHAGYFAVRDPGAPGRPALLALRPTMDTGPRAPRVMRTKLVWDANRQEVVGASPARETLP